MRPTTAADATVRTLINAIPDNRLRELFLELALAAIAVPAVKEPKPAARNGRRHSGRGKDWRRGKSKYKDPRYRGRLDALNAKRRENRRAAALARAAAGDAPKRRGRKPKSNGAQAHGNGTVSAAALWEHARKLEPEHPWKAIMRELGVSESTACFAQRKLTLPEDVSPAAAERFLTL